MIRRYVASSPAAFSQLTKKFITLQDGEIFVVKAQDSASYDGVGIDLIERLESESGTDLAGKSILPTPYADWTEYEINESPAAMARALNHGARLYNDKVRARTSCTGTASTARADTTAL
jgi:glucosamine 6-phosphate synthetase-like amidotransferase/phosphosugar isomerase protein